MPTKIIPLGMNHLLVGNKVWMNGRWVSKKRYAKWLKEPSAMSTLRGKRWFIMSNGEKMKRDLAMMGAKGTNE